jgi:putative acetyltransferase
MIRNERDGRQDQFFQEPELLRKVLQLPLVLGVEGKLAELVKMYLAAEVRGKGFGRILIEKSIEWAIENGYRQVYLETMPELKQALKVYEKFGFQYLGGPMGNTGHFGCDVWMLKTL